MADLAVEGADVVRQILLVEHRDVLADASGHAVDLAVAFANCLN